MSVILHVFSNSIQDNLATLEYEKGQVMQILSGRQAKGGYTYISLVGESIDNINDEIRKYQQELIAFQFSGHAGEDNLVVNDMLINSDGIALQLEEAALNGILELVVLNGCNTHALAKKLEEKKIPVTVCTNAPSNDASSTTFSIHFWQNLVTYNMSIAAAFRLALGPAQTLTTQTLTVFDPSKNNNTDSAWMVLGKKEDLDSNPLHKRYQTPEKLFIANSILYPSLLNDFINSNNEDIKRLRFAEKSTRMIAIINNLPHPISTHLQKLFSPTERSPDGYDKITLKRLEQIGHLYHSSSEFLCYIMIAQLWEIILAFRNIKREIPPPIRQALNIFFGLKNVSRETFDYTKLMHVVLDYIVELNKDPRYQEFIDHQSIYKDFTRLDKTFYAASNYLYMLRESTYEKVVLRDRLEYACEVAEQNLYDFLKPLVFMHRYKLASIQHIDVLKLRHTKHGQTRYRHKLTFLMNSKGGEEESFYYMKSFTDNWSVILIKGEKRRKALTIEEPTFVSEFVDFLNLSFFVIDQNVFIKNADLSDIMFFRGFDPKGMGYKRVSNTLDNKDVQIFPINDNYSPIMKQIRNFNNMILR